MAKREVKTFNGIKKLQCSKCKYWLAFEEFDNDSRASTGKSSYCKVCRKTNYDDPRKTPSNTAIKGVFFFKCEQCKEGFTTKKANKTFCSTKCRKRNWYEKNEQTETGRKYGKSRNFQNLSNGKEKRAKAS